MDLEKLFIEERRIPEHEIKELEVAGPEEFLNELLEELGVDEMADLAYKDYLQREKKILSLMREKKTREMPKMDSVMKWLPYKKIFEDIANKTPEGTFNHLCVDVSKHLIAPLFLKITEEMTKEGSILSQEVKAEFEQLFFAGEQQFEPEGHLPVRAWFAPGSYRPVRLWNSGAINKKTQPPEFITVTSQDEKRAIICINKNLPKRGRGAYGRRISTEEKVVLGDKIFIAPWAVILLADRLLEERLAALDKEARQEDVVYRTILELVKKFIELFCEDDKVFIEKAAYEYCPQVKEFLKTEMKKEPVILSEKEWPEVTALRISYLGYLVPFIRELPRAVLKMDNYYYRNMIRIYGIIYQALAREWAVSDQSKKYRIELMHTARVYETKKNIPDKYLKAMAESEFNRYFGYVEIDADCDLKAVTEISKEFIALNRNCFGERKFKTGAIRFRKLGRHRASGLFIPSLNCLCDDIRSPQSIGHEYFHMLDYNDGELSRKYDFLIIRERYEKLLREWLAKQPADSMKKKMLEGNTKYNIAYYLEPTEIFARCGEMYLKEICGVNNSLVSYAGGFAYPKADEELMNLIKDYYFRLYPASFGKDMKK